MGEGEHQHDIEAFGELIAVALVPEAVCFDLPLENIVPDRVVRALARVMRGRIVGRHAAMIEQQDSTVLQTLIP